MTNPTTPPSSEQRFVQYSDDLTTGGFPPECRRAPIRASTKQHLRTNPKNGPLPCRRVLFPKVCLFPSS